ncbi:hypothetical protein O0544_10770 [Edwardsiella anguillarum]|nr:hypothetical protein [Edwardsiella anguillarum]
MSKITLIGAGSIMFSRQIISALLSSPVLAGSEIILMDLDEQVLARSQRLIGMMVAQSGVPVTVRHTTDRRSARGADFVINAIQVGGLAPWRLDMEIPARYGVIQEVGDTRAGRYLPRPAPYSPMLDILRDMEDLCPQALFINYANPLAPLTWAAKEASGVRSIGLCYGVRYTVAQLVGYLGLGPWVDHPPRRSAGSA